jgi:DnaJ-class molecular chaperone
MNYYYIMELPKNIKSTTEEIRSFYKRLALAHHPDKSTSPTATQTFQFINAAYEILGDAPKRKEYDVKYVSTYIPTPKPPKKGTEKQQRAQERSKKYLREVFETRIKCLQMEIKDLETQRKPLDHDEKRFR